MNSIDRQQSEDNREDLRGEEAIHKIREIADKVETCFFCTAEPNRGWGAARPMNVRQVDEDGNLWFLSASDSHKNQQLARDPSVQLYFQGTAHADFLCLSGRASVSNDRARINALWHPLIRTWFTGGKDDPRISAICVTPTEGHYWDTKHGAAVAGIKMMLGAMLRRTVDDSVQGRLEV